MLVGPAAVAQASRYRLNQAGIGTPLGISGSPDMLKRIMEKIQNKEKKDSAYGFGEYAFLK